MRAQWQYFQEVVLSYPWLYDREENIYRRGRGGATWIRFIAAYIDAIFPWHITQGGPQLVKPVVTYLKTQFISMDVLGSEVNWDFIKDFTDDGATVGQLFYVLASLYYDAEAYRLDLDWENFIEYTQSDDHIRDVKQALKLACEYANPKITGRPFEELNILVDRVFAVNKDLDNLVNSGRGMHNVFEADDFFRRLFRYDDLPEDQTVSIQRLDVVARCLRNNLIVLGLTYPDVFFTSLHVRNQRKEEIKNTMPDLSSDYFDNPVAFTAWATQFIEMAGLKFINAYKDERIKCFPWQKDTPVTRFNTQDVATKSTWAFRYLLFAALVNPYVYFKL